MRKILTSEQCRLLDSNTMKVQNITSLDLMERASLRLVEWFIQLHEKDAQVWVFVGPGNNGGDGWCMGRMLSERGYHTCVIHVDDIGLSADNEANKLRYLEGMKGRSSSWPRLPDPIPEKLIIIDALFGTGLSRPIDGQWVEVIEKINDLEAMVCSVDVPSGLHTEKGIIGPVVRADHTLSIHSVKLAYLLPESALVVGRWSIVDIGLEPSAEEQIETDKWLVDSIDLKKLNWSERSTFDHKGKLGHAMIVAGSQGMMGAAVLATMACLRSGCGLTTALVPGCGQETLQLSCPEAMTQSESDTAQITSIHIPLKITSVGIGPGLGTGTSVKAAIKEMLTKYPEQNLVLDADALNVVASEGLLNALPRQSILTPHPGEFDRIFGKHPDRASRILTQEEASRKYGLFIILKGAYTVISSPEGQLYFNTSGSSALAKGGSGDILTGLVTGLLARTRDPLTACILGAYLHGRAGELAEARHGRESVVGRDVIDQIGNAYKQIL